MTYGYRGSFTMHFYYDASGNPMSFTYSGLTYYYVLNLQGDVVAILNSSGEQVVGYTYDAWGKLLTTTGSMASTLGLYNPLRYRGYVYDRETGLYYLQSRYYNPTWGRFINVDIYTSTTEDALGNNMFVYCGNNPIMRCDSKGESFSFILGLNFNIFGFGGVFSLNLVSTDEDFGIQYSYYLSGDSELSSRNNATLGVDFGPYIGVQSTDKDRMSDLEGPAKGTGGDLFFGMDILTDENGQYMGWQFGTSLFSYNMHSFYTDTKTLTRVRRVNIIKELTNWLLGG